MRPALLLVALLACTTAGCGVSDPYQESSTTTTTGTAAAAAPGAATSTATTAAATSTSTRGTTAATSTVSPASADADEGRPALSPVLGDARRRGERAARTFLASYLPYSYAQRSGRQIRAATRRLRRKLIARPPRVPDRLRRTARPRVRALRVTGVTADRVYVLAQVDDARNPIYATTLTVARHAGRWLVREVR